jgi:hypothetical protein
VNYLTFNSPNLRKNSLGLALLMLQYIFFSLPKINLECNIGPWWLHRIFPRLTERVKLSPEVAGVAAEIRSCVRILDPDSTVRNSDAVKISQVIVILKALGLNPTISEVWCHFTITSTTECIYVYQCGQIGSQLCHLVKISQIYLNKSGLNTV